MLCGVRGVGGEYTDLRRSVLNVYGPKLLAFTKGWGVQFMEKKVLRNTSMAPNINSRSV